jgi:hypothetical protein
MSHHPSILRCLALLVGALFSAPIAAQAQTGAESGTLACDVSVGVGYVVVQKQTMTCIFTPSGAAPVERYTGTITQFGLDIGIVQESHLVWGVVAATSGAASGALAGTYVGIGANASFGGGAGANVLVGGTGRAFSLQPISVQGQTGINLAGGVTGVTLVYVP